MEQQGNAPLKPDNQDLANDDAEKLRNEFLGGISWFYWIGGLSLVNLGFLALADRKFILGLGLTEVFFGMASGSTGSGSIILMALSVLVAALFIGLGFMGRKGRTAFILGGLVFYALDGALLLLFEDYLSVAFHGYAGFMIFKGYRALGKILEAGKAAVQSAGGAAASAPAEQVRSIPEDREKSAV